MYKKLSTFLFLPLLAFGATLDTVSDDGTFDRQARRILLKSLPDNREIPPSEVTLAALVNAGAIRDNTLAFDTFRRAHSLFDFSEAGTAVSVNMFRHAYAYLEGPGQDIQEGSETDRLRAACILVQDARRKNQASAEALDDLLRVTLDPATELPAYVLVDPLSVFMKELDLHRFQAEQLDPAKKSHQRVQAWLTQMGLQPGDVTVRFANALLTSTETEPDFDALKKEHTAHMTAVEACGQTVQAFFSNPAYLQYSLDIARRAAFLVDVDTPADTLTTRFVLAYTYIAAHPDVVAGTPEDALDPIAGAYLDWLPEHEGAFTDVLRVALSGQELFDLAVAEQRYTAAAYLRAYQIHTEAITVPDHAVNVSGVPPVVHTTSRVDWMQQQLMLEDTSPLVAALAPKLEDHAPEILHDLWQRIFLLLSKENVPLSVQVFDRSIAWLTGEGADTEYGTPEDRLTLAATQSGAWTEANFMDQLEAVLTAVPAAAEEAAVEGHDDAFFGGLSAAKQAAVIQHLIEEDALDEDTHAPTLRIVVPFLNTLEDATATTLLRRATSLILAIDEEDARETVEILQIIHTWMQTQGDAPVDEGQEDALDKALEEIEHNNYSGVMETLRAHLNVGVPEAAESEEDN